MDLVDDYFRQLTRILRACGFNSNPASLDLYAAITWCMRYTNRDLGRCPIEPWTLVIGLRIVLLSAYQLSLGSGLSGAPLWIVTFRGVGSHDDGN